MAELHSTTKHIPSKVTNKRDRKMLFIVLIAVIIAEDFIIFYAPIDYRFNYTNYILIVNSSFAVGFAIILLFKQRFEGIHVKIHAAIAIGLILWFSANITWTIYENILDSILLFHLLLIVSGWLHIHFLDIPSIWHTRNSIKNYTVKKSY